jgi:hypothetical protein
MPSIIGSAVKIDQMRDRKEEPNTEFMGGKSFIFIVYYLVA